MRFVRTSESSTYTLLILARPDSARSLRAFWKGAAARRVASTASLVTRPWNRRRDRQILRLEVALSGLKETSLIVKRIERHAPYRSALHCGKKLVKYEGKGRSDARYCEEQESQRSWNFGKVAATGLHDGYPHHMALRENECGLTPEVSFARPKAVGSISFLEGRRREAHGGIHSQPDSPSWSAEEGK